jgi:hypothetical protein
MADLVQAQLRTETRMADLVQAQQNTSVQVARLVQVLNRREDGPSD